MSTYEPSLSLPRRRRFDPAAGLRSLARGRPNDPRWVRPALLAVLVAAGALCVWNLSVNGYANDYYAAAVKAGSESWKAFFFGALDPGSFITVDKPPLGLWLMGASVRAFGFSSLSILLPEALASVAAVALLYTTVRRALGSTAGLLAAAALALTPVSVAVGRFNNPDALLVLTFVVAAWFGQRAIESGRTRQLVGCGAMIGLAFMTKMLEGWIIVPALAAAYGLAGPPRLLVRLRQLALAGLTMVVVSFAWPLAVSLWPGAKPFIGGSANGSIWDLIFGYNGFGRLTGGAGGPGGGGGPNFGGAPDVLRMFNTQVGGQVAWLLPLALVSLVAGIWLTRRAPRSDRARAAWVLWGVWALVEIVVFSAQQGIFHPYYVSALAPAVAALSGGGLVWLGRSARRSWAALVVLDLTVLGTAALAVVLLNRTPSFAPALRWLVPALAGVAVLGSLALRLAEPSRGAKVGPRPARRSVVIAVVVSGALGLGLGPAAYSLATVGRSQDGGNLFAGPAGAEGQGGFGPPGGFGRRARSPSAVGLPPLTGLAGGGPGSFGGGRRGTVDTKLVAFLTAHQGTAKYLVAASSAQTTAPIIIATGKPVVTIGGFTGSDPTPTVAGLAGLVASGQLRYVLVGSGGPGGGLPGGGFPGGGLPGGGLPGGEFPGGGLPGGGLPGGGLPGVPPEGVPPGGVPPPGVAPPGVPGRPGRPGAFSRRDGTARQLDTWVKQHGTVVSGVSSQSGTLYEVRS